MLFFANTKRIVCEICSDGHDRNELFCYEEGSAGWTAVPVCDDCGRTLHVIVDGERSGSRTPTPRTDTEKFWALLCQNAKFRWESFVGPSVGFKSHAEQLFVKDGVTLHAVLSDFLYRNAHAFQEVDNTAADTSDVEAQAALDLEAAGYNPSDFQVVGVVHASDIVDDGVWVTVKVWVPRFDPDQNEPYTTFAEMDAADDEARGEDG